ncbi:MAG: nuclear transport factor 2 family protein [Myxococcota bacterium]
MVAEKPAPAAPAPTEAAPTEAAPAAPAAGAPAAPAAGAGEAADPAAPAPAAAPAAPPGDVLQPGTALVYRVVVRRSWMEDRLKPESASAAGIGICRVTAAPDAPFDGAFRVACEGAEAVVSAQSAVTAWPVWRSDGCYLRRDGGVWFVTNCGIPSGESTLFAPAPTTPLFEARTVRALGREVSARCQKPPEIDPEEHQGDDGGEIGCFTPEHGLVTFETWFGGGMVEDGLVELVGISRAGDSVAVSEDAAREVLKRWLAAQNSQDFAAYSALFAPTFHGVRRVDEKDTTFDREGWLADRQRMFAKPMKVTADDVQIWTGPDRALLLFTQGFATGKFADKGAKQLVVVHGESGFLIASEEMLSSRVR